MRSMIGSNSYIVSFRHYCGSPPENDACGSLTASATPSASNGSTEPPATTAGNIKQVSLGPLE